MTAPALHPVVPAVRIYRRRCLLCRDRDAVVPARGTNRVDAPAVCDECAEHMPVEITGRRI